MELIVRVFYGLRSRWNQCVLRARGVRIEGKCWLQNVSIPRNPWDIHIGSGVMLDERVTLLTTGPRRFEPRIILHSASYINRGTFIDATEKIEIGARCLIGPFCYITDHDHDLARGNGHFISKPTVIEDECWLGAHVTVLKGVRIGRGAVVGAGSVVTRDVPARAIVAGNPAMPISNNKAA